MRHRGWRAYQSQGANPCISKSTDKPAAPRALAKGNGAGVCARNHETVASGESYVNKADCLHVINLIKAVQGETPIKEI